MEGAGRQERDHTAQGGWCMSRDGRQHTINILTNPVCMCACVCVHVFDNKAEKAQLICVPDQILKEAQRKHFKKE